MGWKGKKGTGLAMNGRMGGWAMNGSMFDDDGTHTDTRTHTHTHKKKYMQKCINERERERWVDRTGWDRTGYWDGYDGERYLV